MPSNPRNCVPLDSGFALDVRHQHIRVRKWPYSEHDEYPFRDSGLKRPWVVSPVGGRWSFVRFSYPIPDQVRFPLPWIHDNDLRALILY
jgi:hypothetical protein